MWVLGCLRSVVSKASIVSLCLQSSVHRHRAGAHESRAVKTFESQAMNLSRFLLILAARFKIILLMLAVTAATALLASLLLPKSYQASTTLVVYYKGTDPITGFTLPSQLMPGYMATQIDIIKSMNTALKVVDALKLTESPAVKRAFMKETEGKGNIRAWQAERLLKYIAVAPSRESSVLDISFRASNPQYAADVANAFASAYQQISVQLKVDPSKKAAVYFNDQIRLLREQFENAQQKLSRYQQERGIVNPDNRLDAETAKLNDLSSQLTLVQAQKMDSSTRRGGAQGSGARESPDILANPLIQNLKMQLAQAEQRFAGVEKRYTEEHPFYQQARAELDRIRADFNAQIKATSNSMANNTRILEQRESELYAALEAQKIKVLEFNRMQDTIRILANERDNAQRAYETAAQRFTQANLEGQSNQADTVVLNPAVPPAKAAAPKVMLNLLLSLFLGSMLGVAVAMLVEMLDRRVRSADDLIKALRAPVIGVMVWREPGRRRMGFSRMLLPYQAYSN
jgi:succinoglycan biosynthesis transport protein ExoP